MKPKARQAKILHLRDGGEPLLRMSQALNPRQAARAELMADARAIRAETRANPATLLDVGNALHNKAGAVAGGVPYGVAQAITPVGLPAAAIEANQAYERGDNWGVARAVAGGIPLGAGTAIKAGLSLAQQAATSDTVADAISKKLRGPKPGPFYGGN